ncbi:hypothetical protein BI347_18295 [Chromobacterium sphagni]|uniref:Uncharacterized protein n=1 Tax=Chromobacterium sphagni TaxID=1903179 RepID=A0A1S1WWT9_9NEIS|nr:hypothetical protein BI347_18295 [Chromobacterium sphagni]OHX20681.1 hypothetical protein BI344_14755 [Chromobacterium sphagni]
MGWMGIGFQAPGSARAWPESAGSCGGLLIAVAAKETTQSVVGLPVAAGGAMAQSGFQAAAGCGLPG